MSAQEKKLSTLVPSNELNDNSTEATQDLSLHNEKRDRLFLAVSSIELIAGIALAYIPILPLIPIIPSILIGSGLATFAYQFMGGFKQNDSYVFGGIKIGGAAATLLCSAVVINSYLNSQADNVKISLIEPLIETKSSDGKVEGNEVDREQIFVIRRSDGKLIPLTVSDKGRRSKLVLGVPLFNDKNFKGSSNPIKNLCLNGEGLCKDEWKPVKLFVDDKLYARQAAVCQNDFNRLEQIPLQIALESKKGNEKIVDFGRVSIVDSKSCESSSDQIPIYISRADAEKIGIRGQNLRPNNAEEGKAKIAALKGIFTGVDYCVDTTNPRKFSQCK